MDGHSLKSFITHTLCTILELYLNCSGPSPSFLGHPALVLSCLTSQSSEKEPMRSIPFLSVLLFFYFVFNPSENVLLLFYSGPFCFGLRALSPCLPPYHLCLYLSRGWSESLSCRLIILPASHVLTNTYPMSTGRGASRFYNIPSHGCRQLDEV